MIVLGFLFFVIFSFDLSVFVCVEVSGSDSDVVVVSFRVGLVIPMIIPQSFFSLCVFPPIRLRLPTTSLCCGLIFPDPPRVVVVGGLSCFFFSS